ncbi:hypothetical protein A2U01_0098022, partial [Trifolium medium]|nr:hypothetical protein [Trifolium medium]
MWPLWNGGVDKDINGSYCWRTKMTLCVKSKQTIGDGLLDRVRFGEMG